MIPITSHPKGYPFEIPIVTKAVQGVALADHLKNLDWKAHGISFAGKAPSSVLEGATAKIAALLSI